MSEITSEEGYCHAREDETHCVHWGDGGPCCGCKAPGMSMEDKVRNGMAEGPPRLDPSDYLDVSSDGRVDYYGSL